MRVFVLCTGRSGSVSFIKACSHITNYSSDHESLSRELGEKRFNYKDNHIEADNRLSWHLGELDKRFGDTPFFIHLKRDSKKTAKSFLHRLNGENSIIKAYIQGIKLKHINSLNQVELTQSCEDYVETVTSNIEHFLQSKSKKLTVNLETAQDGFKEFWNLINAEGNLELALDEFNIHHNPSKGFRLSSLFYLIKLKASKIFTTFTPRK
ncbi:MAG: hypothetical protein ACI8P7_000401 [Candidatus Azotimanducaceae bacterium]|jgi:hypothetical protein